MLRLRLRIPQAPMNQQYIHITTAAEPLHALMCNLQKTSKGKRRHDKIAKIIAQKLDAICGITATDNEPSLSTLTKPNNLRADIQVQRNGGVTTMIDVMITNPATRHKVTAFETHIVTARAAQIGYNNVKKHKMAGVDEAEFKTLPFIIETGGRIHYKACEWLDAIADNGSIYARMVVRNIYKAIAHQLNFVQADMLHQYHKKHNWSNTGRSLM